ncbi:MAG: HAMP domain-containing histidine kinase [Ruminococcaceae bacterium]|nr:HAMP domain-containing histidine kinase [Oscillospiraceae bacterium]
MERKESNSGMLDLMVQPAFIVREGIVTQANPAAEKYFIAPGMPIGELLHTGKTEYNELEGGCLYLTLSIAGVPCAASVRKLAEGDIFTLEQDADQSQLQAMALAAQELRGPLSNVMMVADQLFPVTDADDDTRLQVSKINRGLFQLMRIVGNMSDAYRYSQQTEPQMAVLNISNFLEELFEKNAELLRFGGTEIHFENVRQPVFGLADREKLERAVHNILSNAVKFAAKGSPIYARLTRKHDMLYLTVQDEGQGIDNGLRGNVHARFLRQPGLEDSRYGIGLGMVMIRSAAALHGGTVLIDHPESGGTRLTMSLAIRQDREHTVRSHAFEVDYAGARDHTLIELSDVLPNALYESKRIN